jgi:two-component system C4-dicarboxylate transport response regulator DctD
LRERGSDIPLLFSHFLRRAAERFRREAPDVSPRLLQRLASHPWPGNVRELTHFAERVALGLDPDMDGEDSSATPMTLPERVDRFEADTIRQTLADHGGDVKSTVEALSIPRKTFYDKLQRHGISRRDFAEG